MRTSPRKRQPRQRSSCRCPHPSLPAPSERGKFVPILFWISAVALPGAHRGVQLPWVRASPPTAPPAPILSFLNGVMTSLWLCTCQRASSELKEERAENLKDSQVDEAAVSFASFKGILYTKQAGRDGMTVPPSPTRSGWRRCWCTSSPSTNVFGRRAPGLVLYQLNCLDSGDLAVITAE